MNKILVTGGTGYIGSHTIIELYEKGYEIDILDNLFNSKITVLDQIEKISGRRPGFHQIDLLDYPALDQLFSENQYDLVMHFAGLKAVGESVVKPLDYYENNVGGAVNLLKCMKKYNVKKIIFSSSATVYGDPGDPKYVETMPTGQNLANPYGKTKYFIEEIINKNKINEFSYCFAHSSSKEGSINLQISEYCTRILSVHTCKGLTCKIVYGININDINIFCHDENKHTIQKSSFYNVIATRASHRYFYTTNNKPKYKITNYNDIINYLSIFYTL